MIIMAELAPRGIFEEDTEQVINLPDAPKRRSFYDFERNYDEM